MASVWVLYLLTTTVRSLQIVHNESFETTVLTDASYRQTGVEFEAQLVEVQDFLRKLTDHFRGICRIYLTSMKKY